MKRKIAIAFVDFWSGFDTENNFFTDLLSLKYDVDVVEQFPDFIFFSNFGNDHLNYKCPRIFFSSENERPNMFKCDLAITMDYNTNKRHFRMPLFVYYLHQYGQKWDALTHLSNEEILKSWNNKSKFCCAVISNGKSKMRNEFLDFMQEKEQIDSGGRYKNNVGGPVVNKLDFIKDYKFVIAFENSNHKGYTTEKLLEPLIVGSIPLYWGNRMISDDFNTDCCIIIKNKRDFNRVYKLMKKIEKDKDFAMNYLAGSKIKDNQFLHQKNIVEFIERVINVKPISENIFCSLIARFIDFRRNLMKRVIFELGLNFR
jgi:hypothetical protein